MTWSSRFVAALGQSRNTVRLRLRSVRIFTGEAVGIPWGISSWGGSTDPALISARATDSIGASVNPPTFAPRIGVWEIPLAGDLSYLMDRIALGQVVELRVGFDGWEEQDFERVAFGQVWGVTMGRNGSNPVLQIRDALGLLMSRLVTSADETALFASLTNAVDSLASGYTAGDNTLVLNDASDFDDPPGSNIGAVKVTPSVGDPFYLTYTGKSSNTLTGVASAAVYGTTAVNASSSDVVQQVFYNAAHPLNLALRVMSSTGTAGYNGASDVLPKTHGYGLPVGFIDRDDISANAVAFKPASGSTSVMWLSETAQENGLSWLSSQLALTACFLTTRQGCITARPMPTSGIDLGVRAKIGDDEIVSVDRWEAWWGGQQVEYGAVQVTSDSGTTEWAEPISALPAAGAYPHDASAVLKTNETAWRSLLARRLANWFCRWPEYIEITCQGWALAVLAPGDIVRVTALEIPGRLPTTEGGYRNRLSVICSVTPDWFSAVTRLQLFILPSRADGF